MKIHNLTRSARATAAGAALVLVLGACGSAAPSTSAGDNAGQEATTEVSTASTAKVTDTDTPATVADQASNASAADGLGLVDLDTHADGDEADYDTSDAIRVTLTDGASSATDGAVQVTRDEDGETVLITEAGTYLVEGSLSAGQLVVDVPEEDDVTIVLSGVDITSSTGPALQVASADDATIVLAEGTDNQLTDAATYAQTEDTVDEETGETVDAPNAALYSTADLTIAGAGALTVNGSSNDGVTSKDGLVILSGQVAVTAVDDGIRGKDFLSIEGGTITVEAGGDGLTSDNTGDGTGIVLVAGADTDVTVAAGDDAVTAANVVDFVDGTLTVSSSLEGVEAARIIIEGGALSVTSSDDAINAASDTVAASLEISGGSVTLTTEGDGLDSNGTITMTGGEVVINGPTRGGNGSIDADGEVLVSGGTLVAAGTADMLVTPSAGSEQSWLAASFTDTVQAGSVLTVSAADGTVVAEVTTAVTAQALVLSEAALVSGETYTVSVDGTQVASATAGESVAGLSGGQGGPAGRLGG